MAEFAAEPESSGIFLDLDGTIAEVCEDPAAVRPSPGVKESLLALAERLGVIAIVTGRQLEDAASIVGLDELIYIGNHGLESWRPDGRRVIHPDASSFAGTARWLKRQLDGLVIEIPGVVIENKGFAVGVHYRRAEDWREALRRIEAVLAEKLADVEHKLVHGRRIIDIRPPADIDKGTAIVALAHELRLKRLIFAGDDRTDLDAFKALAGEPGIESLTIAVRNGEADPSVTEGADVVLGSVIEMADLLAGLASVVSR